MHISTPSALGFGLALSAAAQASRSVFTVHDDLLAFPQYSISFSSEYMLDIHVSSLISPSPSPSSSTSDSDLSDLSDLSHPPPPNSPSPSPSISSHHLLQLHSLPYLCSIPAAPPPPTPPSSAEAAASSAAEAHELARAHSHGWDLLSDMQGRCLYFISGYWSYEFCYGDIVRQFHQLPPGKDVPLFPPVRDPSAPSFILGRALPAPSTKQSASKEITPPDPSSSLPPGASLHTKGDSRYLSQTFPSGTECDLTGRPRKVEVQFHCHPAQTDRIGWIKEVTTCTYLLVVHTARLCSDAAFIPPRDNQANAISCRRILTTEQATAETEQTVDSPPTPEPEQTVTMVGGVQVGAQRLVGGEGKRLSVAGALAGAEVKGKTEIVAHYDPASTEGFKRLTDKELRKRGISPKDVEDLRIELNDAVPGKAWRLEVVELDNGQRQLRGVVEPGSDEAGGSSEEQKAEEQDEGSEEEMKEEL
ncbi:MAG: Protein OS-9 [Vezdaea aestivalis]|nr:MAG: Protein OS-9 [Vezdaea aestivalis]